MLPPIRLPGKACGFAHR